MIIDIAHQTLLLLTQLFFACYLAIFTTYFSVFLFFFFLTFTNLYLFFLTFNLYNFTIIKIIIIKIIIINIIIVFIFTIVCFFLYIVVIFILAFYLFFRHLTILKSYLFQIVSFSNFNIFELIVRITKGCRLRISLLALFFAFTHYYLYYCITLLRKKFVVFTMLMKIVF